MHTGRNDHVRTLMLAVALVAAVVAFAGFLSACGEGAAEKAIEKAAEQSGQDVDVNIDAGDGSVSISGDSGDVKWQAGENVAIPEGFPTGLIPEGATIISAMTSTESGTPSQLIGFETSDDDKKMYDYFVDALPKAGYEITNKLRIEGGDGNAIAVQGEGPAGTVMISGGGKDGDKYAYTIMVQ